jgi:hypothetical protein
MHFRRWNSAAVDHAPVHCRAIGGQERDQLGNLFGRSMGSLGIHRHIAELRTARAESAALDASLATPRSFMTTSASGPSPPRRSPASESAVWGKPAVPASRLQSLSVTPSRRTQCRDAATHLRRLRKHWIFEVQGAACPPHVSCKLAADCANVAVSRRDASR